jgi:hypothetical protein
MLVVILLATSSFTSSCFSSWEEPRERISSECRYAFHMDDATGKHYTLYIFSRDEVPKDPGTWYSSTVYQGNYRAALAEEKSTTVIVQDTYLFGFMTLKESTTGVLDPGDATLRSGAYIVKSYTIGQPDILVVTQRQTASDSSLRAFYINDGVLSPLSFEINNRASKFTMISRDRFDKIELFKYHSTSWARSMEYTGPVERTWRLNLLQQTFILIKSENAGKDR